jgi:hypothetical protein
MLCGEKGWFFSMTNWDFHSEKKDDFVVKFHEITVSSKEHDDKA